MMVVSVLGLLINLVGLFFFHEHAHLGHEHCSHGGKPKEHKPKQEYKSNNGKANFKPRNEPKDADGDLQEKLAKLKGMFK